MPKITNVVQGGGLHEGLESNKELQEYVALKTDELIQQARLTQLEVSELSERAEDFVDALISITQTVFADNVVCVAMSYMPDDCRQKFIDDLMDELKISVKEVLANITRRTVETEELH